MNLTPKKISVIHTPHRRDSGGAPGFPFADRDGLRPARGAAGGGTFSCTDGASGTAQDFHTPTKFGAPFHGALYITVRRVRTATKP